MEPAKAQEMAISLMKQHGLTDGSNIPSHGWTFEFDRSVRRFGCCHYEDRRITLSLALTKLNSEDEVRDTILHEIAHALAPKGSGHGREWKKVAVSIGCNGQRCYSSQAVVQPPKKFKGTCPNCKREIFRHRRKNISCGRCSKTFNPAYLFIWTNAHLYEIA